MCYEKRLKGGQIHENDSSCSLDIVLIVVFLNRDLQLSADLFPSVMETVMSGNWRMEHITYSSMENGFP